GSAQQSAGSMQNEPILMLAHEMRIARRQKGCGTDSGLETSRADFVGKLRKSAGKLLVGLVPVAERRLESVIELDHLDWEPGSHCSERFQVGSQGVFRDGVKIVVPGAPSAP